MKVEKFSDIPYYFCNILLNECDVWGLVCQYLNCKSFKKLSL